MAAAGRRHASRILEPGGGGEGEVERIDNNSPPKTEEPRGSLNEGADVG